VEIVLSLDSWKKGKWEMLAKERNKGTVPEEKDRVGNAVWHASLSAGITENL
jgi:hypothetical protein